ncbi:hypothetical protein Mlute_00503 [Meiothermus luteus]|jgi:hypothetical protein|uniref:Uncharacterized protein n=1 Tax=Meiothermus luteus TaxID=2026184 RepID=A0A399EZR5_9DEIN|nr:hypothetical protein [Meiothermus luteus]RIH88896.1 hypothetical protein Mlute_00503 [Meiothermus luteus]RMH53894.1 MAG: hypothetical protein D6684_11050 [Deinococcota bacterium]
MENKPDLEMLKPLTLVCGIGLTNVSIAQEAIFAAMDFEAAYQMVHGADETDGIYEDPAYRVPFKAGNWVAVYSSQVVPSPFARGPYANIGFGPLRVLWVNGAGEWGYSEHSEDEGAPGNLKEMKGKLKKLIATIRPVKGIPGFQMPPQKSLDGVLEANAEQGWPLERLMALARGEIELDNPAMRWWR